jgi:hypothetical protein
MIERTRERISANSVILVLIHVCNKRKPLKTLIQIFPLTLKDAGGCLLTSRSSCAKDFNT